MRSQGRLVSFIRALAAMSAMIALGACMQEAEPEAAKRPQRAGEPMAPAETLARIAAADVASMSGDSEAARARIEGIADDMRRSIKLPDATRPVDPEAARVAARSVAGVRSVAWIDRSNLLVIVSRNDARSQTTIDAICLALEPLGDTLGVVVHLQSAAATNGDDLAILSRNCQLDPGDRALSQLDRDVDALPPEVRAQVRAQRAQAADSVEARRRDRENRRILEAGTPEM